MKFSGHLWEQEVQSSSLCTPTKTAVFNENSGFLQLLWWFTRTSVLVTNSLFVEGAEFDVRWGQGIENCGHQRRNPSSAFVRKRDYSWGSGVFFAFFGKATGPMSKHIADSEDTKNNGRNIQSGSSILKIFHRSLLYTSQILTSLFSLITKRMTGNQTSN